ncbi:MAG: hypothetical protein R3B09_19320 [Nannocystaceae bacterium]
MMSALRPLLRLVGASLLLACFVDVGSDGGETMSTPGTTSSSTDPSTTDTQGPTTTTTSSTSTSSSTSTESTSSGGPSGCGDGKLDPDEACDDGNDDDDDACLSTCVPASCGDGFVWAAMEACDEGPANDDKTGACRTNCKEPACGDGAIYLDALGPERSIGGGPNDTVQSDDSPRSVGVSANGTFAAVWSSNPKVYVQRFDGAGELLGVPVDVAPSNNDAIRDPTLAIGPGGEIAAIWESAPANKIYLSRVTTMGQIVTPTSIASLPLGALQAATAGVRPDSGVLVAFSAEAPNNGPMQVYTRRYPGFVGTADGPEVQVSAHESGDAEPPTLAIATDGGAVIAWGDPGGSILYRRVDPEGALGPLVTTSLRVGTGNALPSSRRWSGLSIDGDQRIAIAGVTLAGDVAVQRFEADDAPGAVALASETPPQHAPFVDLAVDGTGNLAVAWTSCGDPMNEVASCANKPNQSFVRWFYADLTPYQPATEVVSVADGPSPIGVASAADGTTALVYVVDKEVVARIAAPVCP